MDPRMQNILLALQVAARGNNAPGIAAFLSSGAYSEMNPNEVALLTRLLRGTPWEGKPGQFYVDWRAAAQQQGNPQAQQQQDQRQGQPVSQQQGPQAMPDVPTGPGTIGYRGNVTGPSAIGATIPSVFDNNRPGGAQGAGPINNGQPVLNIPAAATGGVRDTSRLLPGQEYAQRSSGVPDAPPTAATDNGGQTGGNTGGINSSSFGDVLAGNDDVLMRFALQAAGFNPDIITPATKVAAQKLGALIKARRAAFGTGNAQQDTSGLGQDIASFAKEYTTPGSNFYQNARNYAQGILSGSDFQNNLNGVADQSSKFGLYQALVPLLYGGSNPLVQQSVSDQLGNVYNKWQMDEALNPAANSDILQYIRSNPNLSPLLRSIFGPAR